MKRATILLVVLLVLAGLAAWWYLTTSPQQAAQLMTRLGLSLDQAAQLVGQLAPAEARAAEAALSASGTIEGEEVSITAEVGGRIEALLADEGDEVEAGAVLARLDEALLEAQIGQAQAALETAKAKLAQVKAGTRPEEIAAAQAAKAEAQAAQEGAYRAWQNALETRDDPQQLEAQISQARTEAELAKVQLDQARTALAEAEVLRDHYQLFQASDEDKTMYLASLKQVEAAQANVQAAEAALKGTQVQLEHLLSMKEKPLVLNAGVNAAWAGYQAAQAAVEVAQAGLETSEAGPTAEEVAVAQVGVARAEAALGVLEVQLEKLTLRSPTGGLMTGRMAQVGEMAVPGTSLMTVADLDEVTLTLYIPEDEIGRVKVGQAVEVSVDSFPGEVFEGQVSYISSEAEFTPKNVQTQKERVNMVFAVKVKIPNATHDLKPGMPADAEILLTPQPSAVEAPSPTALPRVTMTPMATPTPAKAEATPTVTPTPTATKAPPSVQAKIIAWGLNVRSGPGIAQPVIATLAKGDTVLVIDVDSNTGWLQVQLPAGEKTGWISGSPTYVSISIDYE